MFEDQNQVKCGLNWADIGPGNMGYTLRWLRKQNLKHWKWNFCTRSHVFGLRVREKSNRADNKCPRVGPSPPDPRTREPLYSPPNPEPQPAVLALPGMYCSATRELNPASNSCPFCQINVFQETWHSGSTCFCHCGDGKNFVHFTTLCSRVHHSCRSMHVGHFSCNGNPACSCRSAAASATTWRSCRRSVWWFRSTTRRCPCCWEPSTASCCAHRICCWKRSVWSGVERVLGRAALTWQSNLCDSRCGHRSSCCHRHDRCGTLDLAAQPRLWQAALLSRVPRRAISGVVVTFAEIQQWRRFQFKKHPFRCVGFHWRHPWRPAPTLLRHQLMILVVAQFNPQWIQFKFWNWFFAQIVVPGKVSCHWCRILDNAD